MRKSNRLIDLTGCEAAADLERPTGDPALLDVLCPKGEMVQKCYRDQARPRMGEAIDLPKRVVSQARSTPVRHPYVCRVRLQIGVADLRTRRAIFDPDLNASPSRAHGRQS
jgi:hypothetical protein